MTLVPRISEVEYLVIKVLWGPLPLTANEVAGAQHSQRASKPNTAKTLRSRLVQKKALDFERSGKAFRCRPLVFGGAAPMFVDGRSYSVSTTAPSRRCSPRPSRTMTCAYWRIPR